MTDVYENVVRDEFAESLRIPLVTSPYPRWNASCGWWRRSTSSTAIGTPDDHPSATTTRPRTDTTTRSRKE